MQLRNYEWMSAAPVLLAWPIDGKGSGRFPLDLDWVHPFLVLARELNLSQSTATLPHHHLLNQ